MNKQRTNLSVQDYTPLSPTYFPELDATPEMSLSDSSYFQLFLVILIWAVELGCIDINIEISMMSSHFSIQHDVHL